MANTRDFPAMLAQMIHSARPQVVPGGRGVQHLGVVKEEKTVGPDYTTTGRELERLGDILYENRVAREKEADEFFKTTSQYQGEDAKAWDTLKRAPQIQDRIKRLQKAKPELFREVEPGVWDVMPSTQAKMGYGKGMAEIEETEARGANIRQTTKRGERMLGADVRKAEAEATSAEVAAQVDRLSQDQQVLFHSLRNRNISAEVALKAAQQAHTRAETRTEDALRGPRKDLLVAEGLDKASQTTTRNEMLPYQQGHMASEEALNWTQQEHIRGMEPYEQRYKLAAAASQLAAADADVARAAEIGRKIEAEARNNSVKELWKVREEAYKTQVALNKTRGGWVDPFEDTIQHMRDTQSMMSGFGDITISVGQDPKTGESIPASVPGSIEDPAARYWVWKSLEKSYDTFERMWKVGDKDSLTKARQLRDEYYKMYQSTYGAVKDPKAMQMLRPMPGESGYKGDSVAVNELFTKMITMILTVDQLEDPKSPNRLKANDPIWLIAKKYGIEPLPATDWGPFGAISNRQGVKKAKPGEENKK